VGGTKQNIAKRPPTDVRNRFVLAPQTFQSLIFGDGQLLGIEPRLKHKITQQQKTLFRIFGES
jgi:hypothetical protein